MADQPPPAHHPLRLDGPEPRLDGRPDVLDPVELGVVRHVPDDCEVQQSGVIHRYFRSVDGRVVQHESSHTESDAASEVCEEVSETLCIEALLSDVPKYKAL